MEASSEARRALRDIANNLNKLNGTLTKIEKDLHSIDISLGLMRPEKKDSEPVMDIGEMARHLVDTYGEKGGQNNE